MMKKFTIEKVDHEQLSDTNGTIRFYLMDSDNGEERIVQASTIIKDNEPQSIFTNSVRELPLIETLFQNRNKRKVEIEFERFNSLYDRDNSKGISPLAYRTAMNMHKKIGLTERILRLLKP